MEQKQIAAPPLTPSCFVRKISGRLLEGSHKLSKAWKIAKKSYMHGKIIEFEKNELSWKNGIL